MADAFTKAKMKFLDRGMHDARLTYAERMVHYEIVKHLNRVSGDAWPSQETIRRNIGMKDVRTVVRAVKRLVGFGYYEVTVDGRRNSYRPLFDGPANGDKMSPNEAPPNGDIDAANGDKNRTQIGDKNRPLSSLSKPIDDLSPLTPHDPQAEPEGAGRGKHGGDVGAQPPLDGEVLGPEDELTFEQFWQALRGEPGKAGPARAAWQKLPGPDRHAIGTVIEREGAVDLDGAWACTWLRDRCWTKPRLVPRASGFDPGPLPRAYTVRKGTKDWHDVRAWKIARRMSTKMMDEYEESPVPPEWLLQQRVKSRP